MRTELNGFERNFATAAIAIDTLWGGNHEDPTGADHLIVDAYCSGMEKPDILPSDLKALFLKEGIGVSDPKKVSAFLEANEVERCLEDVAAYAHGTVNDRWRRESILHQVNVLRTQLALRKSMVGLTKEVSDEKAYKVAFGREPGFIDASEARETLTKRLSAVGLEVADSTSLTDLVDAWKKRSSLDADQMESQWAPMSREMHELTVSKIFPYLPEWVSEIPPDNVDFGIIREKVFYSGVNLALHTMVDDKPIYRTIMKISDTVTRSKPDFKLGLVAHENMPGHGLHIPLMHGLYARGEYGFETTLMVLCSPLSTLAEGLATSTTNLLYGSDLEDALSSDELVAVAVDDLGVVGRNNVAVKFIQGEKDPDRLADFLRTEHCFSEGDAKKYTGWLFHPRMGKLLGVMYLPSYGVGREIVRSAIEEHGREAVIPVVYGTKGQIDIINFNDRLIEA